MGMRTAFIFPGQGSQYVGMGKPLWDAHGEVRALYLTASGVAGFDVAAVSFEGPADELDSDVTAQVAVYTANEAHRMAAAKSGLLPDAVTGYSLGFYSALICAGSIGFAYGLEAVISAGELAVSTSGREPGTMAAVIGLSAGEVEALCEEASGAGGVWVSNVNAARQVLVSGSVGGVNRAVEIANGRGALSAFVLNMGAAYHSPMMEEVAEKFGLVVSKMEFGRPSLPVMSYLDARYLEGAADISSTVASQIARKVLWRDTITALISDGVSRFIEAGPGSALTRMVRWVDRSVAADPVEELLGITPAHDAAGGRR